MGSVVVFFFPGRFSSIWRYVDLYPFLFLDHSQGVICSENNRKESSNLHVPFLTIVIVM